MAAKKTTRKKAKQSSKSVKKTGKAATKKIARKAAKKVTKNSTQKTVKKASKKKAVSPAAGLSKKKIGLLVVDGHAMAYRAYYSMQNQNLVNPVTGQPTTAIYGFFRMLFKALFDFGPDRITIVWDPPGGKSFRNEMYPQYKAQRKPMPDDLRFQIDEIKELVKNCGFGVLELKGFEADDVMGTLAARFGKKWKVVLLSGDKDCYQLLNKNVSMIRSTKGVTEFTEIDPAWVQQDLGITIKQVTDYMGLVGDSADNIPGAKGVGPKSAAKLLEDYKDLKGIYKNLDKVSGKSLKAKLEESKENVFLSQELATIKLDLPEILDLDESILDIPDLLRTEVLQMFRHGGYNQLYNDLKKERERRGITEDDDSIGTKASAGVSKAKKEYSLVMNEEQLQIALVEFRKDLKKSKGIFCIDTETDHQEPMRARLVGISLSAKAGRAWYISCPPVDSPYADQGVPADVLKRELQALLAEPDLKLVGQNIKYDMLVLARWGFQMPAPFFDTMIASYLCNPNVRRHNMDDMALDLLGHSTIHYEDVVGSGRNKTTMDQIEPEKIRDYACEDADITLQLYQVLEQDIAKRDLKPVFENIEIALIPVLGTMELAGVAIDQAYFSKLASEYGKKLISLEKKIHKAAGREFNINSTRELQVILFEELGLPPGKKTKTGYSTDQSVLEDLRGQHKIIDSLLENRKYSKLKSTYIDALPALINERTGRIHTSFNQTIAATGRLSSVDPNLQNIPIREETGRAIRRGFVPSEGNQLLSLDYSQIELRIMAHYSEDQNLIETFIKDDIDIHKRTAASLFEVEEDAVDKDMRAQGKAVNFSIIYGVTEFGLARNLGISREEARLYIERFFMSYPGVKAYMDDTIAYAEEHGHVLTLTGRRRQIAEIKSNNRFRREGAQRTAINTPIQGTSADIIKLAMIAIHADMRNADLKSKMILQVHDELLFDVVPDEKERVLQLARDRMQNAMQLLVPLKVDYGMGNNWDEAH